MEYKTTYYTLANKIGTEFEYPHTDTDTTNNLLEAVWFGTAKEATESKQKFLDSLQAAADDWRHDMHKCQHDIVNATTNLAKYDSMDKNLYEPGLLARFKNKLAKSTKAMEELKNAIAIKEALYDKINKMKIYKVETIYKSQAGIAYTEIKVGDETKFMESALTNE